jgi:hypothetical protein
MGFHHSFYRADPYVRQIHGPDQNAMWLERLERAERPAQGRDWPRFWLWILHDDAVVAGDRGLDARRVGPQHYDAGFHFEGFQRFQDSDDERQAEEIQQGFGRTHPSRPAGRQDHAR